MHDWPEKNRGNSVVVVAAQLVAAADLAYCEVMWESLAAYHIS
ncbi:MAG: hypothetical protein ACFFCW_48665 [Candidatus Hodarchaeota archaeon]